jgi:sec-independent protein translocase protein TatC
MVDTPMPLTSHLSELRTRLLWSVVALAGGFVICYALSNTIVAALQSPFTLVGTPITVPLQIIAPAEGFLTYLKVGFVAGLFLVLPVILYQLWQFVAPGLLEHEIRYTIPFIFGSTLLFYSGGLVCYLMLPLINSFLLSFATGPIGAQLSVSAYVAFCIWLMIAFGLVFQMPMAVIFLAQLEIVSSRMLIHNFRYAVVFIFILAAILTPSTDPVSQTFMALPTLLLYSLSIIAVKRIEKRRASL